MLVTLKEVLKVAEEKEIAIGAFNAPNLESLQAVMAAAEEMDLPVDESVIREFIHHEDVAEDVAAYFELYRKYRDDYGIADILAGKVRPETFARIYAAAFDESLSVVNLLLDGLSAFFEEHFLPFLWQSVPVSLLHLSKLPPKSSLSYRRICRP